MTSVSSTNSIRRRVVLREIVDITVVFDEDAHDLADNAFVCFSDTRVPPTGPGLTYRKHCCQHRMVHFPCQRSSRASPKFQTHLGCLAALQLVGAFSSAARSKQPSHTDNTRPSQQTQPAGTTKTRSCNRRTRRPTLTFRSPRLRYAQHP